MPFPKQIKKNIDLVPNKVGLARRKEMLQEIEQDGTFLPKSILHADLDRGFLDFVKENLGFSVEGKQVPVVDIIVTTQNWAQFTQTWKFQDLDKNASPPFVTAIRSNDMKYGSNPSLQYTIPVRREFFYAYVPTFDGQRTTVDVYQIPQPIPIDIKYTLKFICNRVREINQLNKTVLENFSSRQAYTRVKGHYIPIIWDNVSDESVMEIEKRKYYIVSYDFTMLGFLIDEDEFVIKPGITRNLQLLEASGGKARRQPRKPPFNTDKFYENIYRLKIISKYFHFDIIYHNKIIFHLSSNIFDTTEIICHHISSQKFNIEITRFPIYFIYPPILDFAYFHQTGSA